MDMLEIIFNLDFSECLVLFALCPKNKFAFFVISRTRSKFAWADSSLPTCAHLRLP